MVVEVKDDDLFGRSYSHPSYGVVRFTRRQGRTELFGSEIAHESTIALSIHSAQMVRNLNHGKVHHSNMPLIEVEMSAHQFAELLTTFNVSEGTPCTIRRTEALGYVNYEAPYKKGVQQEATRVFKEVCDRIADQIEVDKAELAKILDKKNIGKADREEIGRIIGRVQQHLKANLPFAEEMFRETTAKTVAEAKSEVDAFASMMVQRAGLKAMSEAGVTDVPALEGDVDG